MGLRHVITISNNPITILNNPQNYKHQVLPVMDVSTLVISVTMQLCNIEASTPEACACIYADWTIFRFPVYYIYV